MKIWVILFLSVNSLRAADAPPAMSPLARAAKAKYDLIMDEKAKPGSVIVFSQRELEELGKVVIPTVVPDGFREPRINLGTGIADGAALVDFKKLRHSQGIAPSWLDNLIDGERPVKVFISVSSANGYCTVNLNRLEVSKVAATGRVLDVLVKTFFLSLYPNAKINEPFELEHRISHVEVKPNGLYVTIRKK